MSSTERLQVPVILALTIMIFISSQITQVLAFNSVPSLHRSKRTTRNHSAYSHNLATITRTIDINSSSSTSSLLRYKSSDVDSDARKSGVAVDEIKDVVKRKGSRVISSTPIKNLVKIDNLDDFIDFMYTHRDQLVVVRFYASWCKTCQRTEPFFSRFARRNPEIAFVNIPYTQENCELHKVLNVTAVPSGQIYSSGELVENLKLSTKGWSAFENTVKRYSSK